MTNNEELPIILNSTPTAADMDLIEETQSEPTTGAIDLGFTLTPATYSAPKVGSLYRYLNWVNDVQTKYSINLDNFSAERQAGVAVLVDHGLVSERRYVGGFQDGRRTFRLTPEGKTVLALAWSAANEVVTG